jgi:hypothetical protein
MGSAAAHRRRVAPVQAARGWGAGAGGAREGAGAGAVAMIFFREAPIGSWVGVGVNFRPLLYAGQHANEKNRGSICMLGWSCSYCLPGRLLLDYYCLLAGKGVRAGWEGLRAGWERLQRSVDATGTSMEGGSGEA